MFGSIKSLFEVYVYKCKLRSVSMNVVFFSYRWEVDRVGLNNVMILVNEYKVEREVKKLREW